MTELGFFAFGFLILAAISAEVTFDPTWERSGPVVPPLPPILWHPTHPDAATSFFPCVMAAPAAGFFAAIFFPFAAPTAPELADRPTAVAKPSTVMVPQSLLCIVTPFRKASATVEIQLQVEGTGPSVPIIIDAP